MKSTKIRTYSELSKIPGYEDRFEYLKLQGFVGEETFGYDRYLNQDFYRSREWKRLRDYIITRDMGCDMGVDGWEIAGRIVIHHMNPVEAIDIIHSSDYLLDPEFLICVSHNTHNAIHYGDKSLLILPPVERTKNDTCPWKK